MLIVGDNELKAGEAMLRDMATRDQTPVALDRLVETLRQHLENS